MDDDTTSVTAALFGLAGFEILAAADAGGELELLVQTTADLVGCPACGAVARAKDRRPTWVRDLPLARAAGGPLLGQADLVVPAAAVRAADLDRAACGDRPASPRCPGRSSGSGDVGIAAAAKHAPRQPASGVPEEARSVVHKRYEVRVSGSLSERARNAFPTMDVTSIPTQTIVFGELAGPSD